MGRVKDTEPVHNHILEGLSPEMVAFHKELEQKFPSIRYTSGKRTASQKIGKNAGHSHHETGNALDFAADHKDVYEYLNNTTEGLALLKKYGFGIIDETDPETMAKTGATGKHYHIGKDSHYVAQAKTKYASLSQGEATGVYSKESGMPANMLAKPVEFTLMSSEGPKTVSVLPEDFENELEKIKVIEQKVQDNQAMLAIEARKESRKKFFEAVGANSTIISYYPDQEEESIPNTQDYTPIETNVQASLENMPSIFSTGQLA